MFYLLRKNSRITFTRTCRPTFRAYINPTTTPLLEEPVVMVISNTAFALYKIPKNPPRKMLKFRSGRHSSRICMHLRPHAPRKSHLHLFVYALTRDRPRFPLFVERSLKELCVPNDGTKFGRPAHTHRSTTPRSTHQTIALSDRLYSSLSVLSAPQLPVRHMYTRANRHKHSATPRIQPTYPTNAPQ